MNSNLDDYEDGDAGIEQLLQEVGTRGQPSADFAKEIRAAVHAEWLAVVEQRSRRRRMLGFGIAAGVITAVLGVVLVAKFAVTPLVQPSLIAAIANVHADSQISVLQVSASQSGASWRDIAVGEKLSAGLWLRTDAATSAAIDYGNGLSVRIDRGTLLQLTTIDRMALERGRVYIDAPSQRHVPLVVQTKFGALEHLGTQYQAHLENDRLFVSVREGRVAVAIAGAKALADAGERVEFGSQGEIARSRMSPQDSSWAWAATAAPTFNIENQSLASFLDWIARQTGRTVRYATPEVRKEAEELMLRGSIMSLSPDQALDAVLATTRFVHTTSAASIDISR
jgi:ferric-dicitrate binding protein FerR (iron transport regulator)